MTYLIILALINGIAVGIARAINGRLTISKGPFKASYWNHIVGFLFLSLLILLAGSTKIEFTQIPGYVFLGGVIGAFYVVVNSYIIPKLGATISTMLVISGQLITSAIFDAFRGLIVIDFSLDSIKLPFGILLISLGVFLSFKNRI